MPPEKTQPPPTGKNRTIALLAGLYSEIKNVHKTLIEKPTASAKEIVAVMNRLAASLSEKIDRRAADILKPVTNIRDDIRDIASDKPVAAIEKISGTSAAVLETIERHHRETLEKAPLMAAYPSSGKKELPVGTTKINLKEAKVDMPGGTREDIYVTRPLNTCRSFTIFTSRQIDVRASRNGVIVYVGTLFAGSQQTNNLSEFDTVEIETDAVTAFHITLSEDAEGAPTAIPEAKLTSALHLGYNAAGDLVSFKKVIDGVTYQRDVTDPDVADTTVDRWVVHSGWSVV